MLVMDNWFTSARLLKKLIGMKIYGVDTVKTNMGLPPEFAKVKSDENQKEIAKAGIGKQGMWVYNQSMNQKVPINAYL